MCLAIPVRIESIGEVAGPSRPAAATAPDGRRVEVDLALLPEAAVGDYVIAHSGYGVNLLTPEEATHTLELLGAAGERSEN